MKDFMILKNEVCIPLEEGSSLSNLRTIVSDMEAFEALRNALSEENLEHVEIYNSENIKISELTNMVLVSLSILGDLEEEIEGILCVISLRESTRMELRIKALEASQVATITALTALTEDVNANTNAIYETQVGLVETFEQTEENTADIVDLENALVEVYESLVEEE